MSRQDTDNDQHAASDATKKGSRLAHVQRALDRVKKRIAGDASTWRRRAMIATALVLALVIGIAIGHDDEPTVESIESASVETEHQHAGASTTVWTCSMHPQIRMEEPGQCPICGMDLIPATPDESAEDEKTGTRRDLVSLSPRAKALAAIKTAPAQRASSRTELRLLGRIDYDETRIRTVTPWTAGRIDDLKVQVTGARIKRNQIIATLYSPEIYSAMRDLVTAARQAEQLAGGLHGSAERAQEALRASKERLRLLGVSDPQINQVLRTKNPPTHVQIRSPFAGTVIERLVDEGQYVEAGTPLYRIADLSRVWVQIDAYENDLPYLRMGQEVVLKVEGLPGETFTGRTAFIDPVVDERERTARVRVEVDNPDGRLRPGMFVVAMIEGKPDAGPSPLVIPETAPLFTGRRSVVFVEVPGTDEPTYELRVVRLGAPAGSGYPVLSGLNEGERVVVEGAFVLDADLQLRGGRSMMTRADDVTSAPPDAPPVSGEFRESLRPVVEAYLQAQELLARDELDDGRKSLHELAQRANQADPLGSRKARDAWQEVASPLVGHARHAASSTDEGELRKAFEKVSVQIAELFRVFGNPLDTAARLAFCPLALDSKGAEWIQRDEPLANPYYGQAMLRHGEFRATVLPSERLAASVHAEAPPPAAAGGHQH